MMPHPFLPGLSLPHPMGMGGRMGNPLMMGNAMMMGAGGGFGGLGSLGGSSMPSSSLSSPSSQSLSSASAVVAQAIAAKRAEESLSHEENLTLSNPNQRYALMQKLARGTSVGGKASSRCMVLKNMVGPDDVDDELEAEITDEASKYGIVERVVIYQERQSEKPGDVVIKIFILFLGADRT
jgi:poly(U)-binding-splicing factor PUF60